MYPNIWRCTYTRTYTHTVWRRACRGDPLPRGLGRRVRGRRGAHARDSPGGLCSRALLAASIIIIIIIRIRRRRRRRIVMITIVIILLVTVIVILVVIIMIMIVKVIVILVAILESAPRSDRLDRWTRQPNPPLRSSRTRGQIDLRAHNSWGGLTTCSEVHLKQTNTYMSCAADKSLMCCVCLKLRLLK